MIPTAKTYPERYTKIVGHHRLVGWGDYETMRESILPRVFGFLVRATEGTVKEYHGDLFHDAEWLRRFLDAALANSGYVQWDVCVRHSGTNVNGAARIVFESYHYDAALYNFHLYVDERGEWWLDIDLIDARPDRPETNPVGKWTGEMKTPRVEVGQDADDVFYPSNRDD